MVIIYKVYLLGCCGVLLMVCPSAADLLPFLGAVALLLWLFWSDVSFLMCVFAFAVLFRLYVSILH